MENSTRRDAGQMMSRTLAERREASAAALARHREREAQEYMRQRSLPTLEDKVKAIGEAVTTLLSVVRHEILMGLRVDAAKITDIAVDLDRVLGQETRANEH